MNQKRMLNSILNRTPRKIVLDRVLDKYTIIQNTDEEQVISTLVTDPKTISHLANSHYQSVNIVQDAMYLNITDASTLLVNWQHIYELKSDGSSNSQSAIIEKITLTELKSALKSSPKKKAAGPSRLTYEDLKLLDDKNLLILLKFYNILLSTNFILDAWLKANLHPIPKLKQWGSELNNIRPIVLLETPRKLFTCILNKRLNNFLSINNSLEFNNQAGIAGSSTFESLKIISHIIEHSSRFS
jgi:hypothetical protein